MKRCSSCQTPYPDEFAFCPVDGAELEDAGVYAVGTTIRNKYRILAQVGRGGMGHVYKALHLHFNEVRALKVMDSALTERKEFVTRFLREAFVARRLQHPHAVRVDDVDQTEDGRYCIVMEFIDGRMLRDVLQPEEPLPLARACSIIMQAASALDASHQLGIIHRDIKPENIALIKCEDGDLVKVLDFGITKLREGRLKEEAGVLSLSATSTVFAMGTPEYMSPEQILQKELDGRSDLYSLGVVFYEMLTGHLPFHAESQAEWFLAHVGEPPRPFDEQAAGSRPPAGIAALVMSMLEKDPQRRPANGAAVIEAIEACKKEIAAALTPNTQATLRIAAERRTTGCTTAPAFFDGWQRGSLIGQRYKILDQVAEVRMGPIYTAMDSGNGSVCVLKLVTPWNIPTADLINQLSEYYQRMQRFQHPHVVRTLELGQAEDGVLFLVSEYVPGANLRQVIRQETPLAISRASRIVWEVAFALDAGQQLGMVHGDIKPEHILLTGAAKSEQAKLLDFSLDRVKDALPELSDSDLPSVLLAPLHYMPPEKVSGQPYLPASDIYSLGIVFYEMLTGRRPFEGSGIEVALRQVQETPVSVDQIRPELNISPGVARVVMEMIRKDPADRTSNARTVMEQISAL
jgi:serine/threonine protein kinase